MNPDKRRKQRKLKKKDIIRAKTRYNQAVAEKKRNTVKRKGIMAKLKGLMRG